MMAADGVTVQTLYSRMVLLCTPSETLAFPAIATVVCDRVLPKPDGRVVTDGWSEVGTALAEAPWTVFSGL